jgi:cAMP-dependent protein kinase regulator
MHPEGVSNMAEASRDSGHAPKPAVNIPEGFTDLLKNFAVAVLRAQPEDLTEFAAEYFQNKLKERSKSNGPNFSLPTLNGQRRSSANSENSLPHLTVERPVYSSDEDDDSEPFQPPIGLNRRKSVAAERYNPEEDDEDDNEDKLIHPKTDEQRKRLLKAIDGIFLFKNLDSSQLQDLVDAMFEKTVNADDMIIQQGDDGDNFYVIDRYVDFVQWHQCM